MNAIQLHIPPEDLEVAFDEYEAGETITSVADMLGIPVQRFKSLYESARGKPEMKKTEETINVTSKRKKLTDSQKQRILKELEKGESAVAIAAAFGISSKTVYNIKSYAAKKEPVITSRSKEIIEKSDSKDSSSIKLTPRVPDISVTFEADYIVVRIPRKTVLASLLRDLI